MSLRIALLLSAIPAAFSAVGCSHVVERSNAGIALLEEHPAPVGPAARGAKYAGWVISAPLVVAMVPVAAVAWATPWVDLPMAVDIATASSIALGYVAEACVGLPLYAAFFWVDEDREGDRSPDLDPVYSSRMIPWGFIVAHRAAARSPRPPRPVPPELLGYYAVPEGAPEKLRREIAAALRESPGRARSFPLRLVAGFPATLEFYTAPAPSGEARPLVLMTPPTKAAFAARYLAKRYAKRGVHSAVIVPDTTFLETSLDARQIETKFRAAVISSRTVLRALSKLEQVDAQRLLYLGISAGGIFGAILLAVEPAIDRAVLILPGGDLPRIIAESDESSVEACREAWRARGVNAQQLAADFAREIRTDPRLLARHIDPRRLLIFLGASDTRVPTATGLALRKALGDPELYLLSGNHETACLCFGFILRRTDAFLLGETAGR